MISINKIQISKKNGIFAYFYYFIKYRNIPRKYALFIKMHFYRPKVWNFYCNFPFSQKKTVITIKFGFFAIKSGILKQIVRHAKLFYNWVILTQGPHILGAIKYLNFQIKGLKSDIHKSLIGIFKLRIKVAQKFI